MKRDMDLVRKILMELADSQNRLPASVFVDAEHNDKSVGYHFKIMQGAGLIDALILESDNDPYWRCEAINLTWKGHEFLANIKSDSI